MTRIARVRGRALALALLAGVTAACESNITDSDALDAVACKLPAGLAVQSPFQSLSLADLQPALLHAAGPMVAALGSSEEARQLTQAMEAMADAKGPAALDTACRLIGLASDVLATLPDTPETLPDREGIHLVLLLAAGITGVGGS